jgi:endonuclease/exonuclease/phosphatase (EEP) superfamily protein YafD
VRRHAGLWLTLVMQAVVWAFGAVSLVALLDRFSAYLGLLTFFRIQYAVLLVAAGAVAFAVRRVRLGVAAVLLAGLNVALVAPTWFPPPSADGPRTGALRLLVLNLEDGNREHEKVARLIAQSSADVVGLTELTPTWARALRQVLVRYPDRSVKAEKGAYGIGLFSRRPLTKATVARFPSDGPASIVARLEVGDEPFTVVLTHVHTPAAGDIHRRQFEALADARKSLGERLAICGDLNAVPWSSSFRHLASDGELIDSQRGHGLDASWPAWSALLRVPIDNCLVSRGVNVLDRDYGDDVGSDHFPLAIRLGITARSAAGGR